MTAGGSSVPSGGVLSGGEIERLQQRLIEPFERDCLRTAGYDVRIGGQVITPTGTLLRLAESSSNGREIVLEPGESAVFLTEEILDLPLTIAGNLTLKTGVATRGLLLLSGMLIDPGYSGHLHLCVANLGSRRAVLRRGDKIAAVQFFPVVGTAPKSAQHSASAYDAQFLGDAPIQHPVAFLDDLRKLRIEHDELARETQKTADLARNVITLGFFLVGATILGIVLDVALTIGSNKNLVTSLRGATPHTLAGKILVAVCVASAAWAIYSVAIFASGRRHIAPPTDNQFFESEARLSLLRRRRLRLLVLMLSAVLPAVAIVLISTAIPGSWGRYLWPAIVAVLIGIWAWLGDRWLEPITAAAIHERAESLKDPQRGSQQ